MYAPTPWNQVWTWTVFFLVWLLSWDGALGVAIARFNYDLGVAFRPREGVHATLDPSAPVMRPGLRRPYLIALALYSIAVAWFNIAFFFLLIFLVNAIVCMTATMETPFWERVTRAVASPNVVFNCVDLPHVAWHATAAAAMLFASSVIVGFYVTDDDLADENATHGKALRALFTAPALAFVAYMTYALICALNAMK